MKNKKHVGSSIIFVNPQNQILLFLRDDKPGLPYRNMWDVPGGHLESEETPKQTIAREMKEEMNLDLKDFHFLCKKEFKDRTEYTYWKEVVFKIEEIDLMEGQCLKWFTRGEAAETELAYGFNEIVEEFYRNRDCLNAKFQCKNGM
ncbi:MAG: NUDIX domain-containing protein [Candidatus Cloacimonetes bacterium]|nr:NUDIX domain-containing protein [Candidatus Cloacimonadota bacterium]MCF7814742.1 NUDIX domain-containing protein [Candidatus Cloacimonadota bacterium]MCF7868010.1 NUDIX domain-containing protein [Candidatus Cloacimonadota bacterium]MCF7883468.1 NUDIX domain-containing protein [Candidatus Cloacimonadota bacterium]